MSAAASSSDEEPVYLHLYDLSMGMAAGMSQAFLGISIPYIPHTGLVAWGHEFFYSGGISVLKPHVVVQTFGLAPIQKILLGHTKRGENDLRVFLRSISHKYTADKYDLFRHNCNNFTLETASWLFEGSKPSTYPQIILDIPNLVLSTPMGASIGQMMAQNDPFAAARNGGLAGMASSFMSAAGGGGAAAGSGAPAMPSISIPAGGAGSAPASAATPNAAFEAALKVAEGLKGATAILESHSSPLLSENTGNVTSVVDRLMKVNELLPNGSPHRLTDDEKKTLTDLAPLLTGKSTLSADAQTSTAKAACLLLTKMHRCWPRSQSAFPVLALLRLLTLREDCASVLIEGPSAVLWDVVETVGCSGGLPASTASPLPSGVTAASEETTKKDDGGAVLYGHYPSDVMALTCLANAFKVPALAKWASQGSVFVRLVDSICRILTHAPSAVVAASSSPGTSAANATPVKSGSVAGNFGPLHPYSRPELRSMAAALAFNTALTMKVGSDTITTGSEAGGSTKEGDATTVISDASVQLLSALLDSNIAQEKDAEAQKRRLLAAGRILMREGEECATLAVTLGLDEPLKAVANDVTLQGPGRVVAKEVLNLLAKATAATTV